MTKSNGNTLGAYLKFFAGFGLILAVAGCASPAALPSTPPVKPAAEQSFTTPDEAVDTLITAAREDNKAALAKVLGPHAEKIIHSGDKVADKAAREKFLAAYDKLHAIDIDEDDNDHATLVVGSEEWPMPIPLVRTGSGWWFDTATGEEEILNRRIGRNELNVIEVCRAYVDAQREFSAQHKLGDHKHEYAQRLVSTSGQHDGLYWPAAENEPQSPFGPLIASATAEGYNEKTLGKQTPYHGYYYKILTKQGPNSPMGAKDYMVGGHMTRGFALIAFPARYGDSGVMTFIVNRHGIVFQKNFGPDTAKIAAGINAFDPDSGWSVVP